MAVIRVQVRQDGVTTVLRSVKKTVAKGALAVQGKALNDMKEVFARHNRSKFNAGKRRGGWKRVSVPTLVFSRREDWVQEAAGNMGQLRRKADAVEPLLDTGRLEDSLINPFHPNFRIRVTRLRITNSTNVPYAPKHTQAKIGNYKFGPTQKGRLNQRVPKPKKGRRQKKRTTVGVVSLKGTRGEGSRPHFRLRTWAEKRYPTSAQIPKRTWIGEPSRETVSKIERVVTTGVLQRAIRTGVKGRVARESGGGGGDDF